MKSGGVVFPISKILAPVDFSHRSLGMLPYAKALASRYDAELTLLHVVNPMYTLPAAGPFGPLVVPIPQSAFEDAAKRLDHFGADELEAVNVRRLIYEGDPAEQILALTKSED